MSNKHTPLTKAPKAPLKRKIKKANVVAKAWWKKKGGKQSTINVGKSVALSAAGWGTWAVVQRHPQFGPLHEFSNYVAQNPAEAIKMYVGLRAAKGYTDYRLLRGTWREYNMDPAQTMAHNAVFRSAVGRTNPITKRPISEKAARRGSAAAIASGATVVDIAKQEAIKRPMLGLGGAFHGNPGEIALNALAVTNNLGVLAYRGASQFMLNKNINSNKQIPTPKEQVRQIVRKNKR